MRWTMRAWLTLAAASGFVAVAAGAFAAHGMKDPGGRELMRTASTYELFHALAVFACALLLKLGAPRARFAPALFLGGSLLFSGSLYALALGAPRMVGVVTPFGGLMFLAGWLVLAWSAPQVEQTS